MEPEAGRRPEGVQRCRLVDDDADLAIDDRAELAAVSRSRSASTFGLATVDRGKSAAIAAARVDRPSRARSGPIGFWMSTAPPRGKLRRGI